MRYGRQLILLMASAVLAWGQASTPAVSNLAPPNSAVSAPVANCSKNVSFAVAEGGQPVPDIPKFALKWLESKSSRERFSKLCFSQIPSAAATNYIVVFSSSEAAFEGLSASAHTYTTATAHGNTSSLSSYGGTWSYVYNGVAPPPTTNSLELKRDDKPKALDVRAFDQSGRAIARYSLAAYSSREKLLEQVLSDIVGDNPPPENRKTFASPMSVYYVNCDVDSPGVQNASLDTPLAPPSATTAPRPQVTAAQPPPAPKPQVDVWSSPEGADIFLDGGYVGKTPYSLAVDPGEHTIDLRKKGFAIWQRRVMSSTGTRRVGGTLEQKVLDLP